MTRDTLHAQSALLANLECLAIHAFAPIPPQTYDYLLKAILSFERPFSPAELLQQTPLVHQLRTKSFLWKLVYNGKLLTDLTQPLNFTATLLTWQGQAPPSLGDPPAPHPTP